MYHNAFTIMSDGSQMTTIKILAVIKSYTNSTLLSNELTSHYQTKRIANINIYLSFKLLVKAV